MDKKTLDSILKNAYNLPLWRQVLTDVFGVRNLNQTPQKILLPSNDLAENAFELGFFNTTDDRIIGFYQIDLNDKPQIWRNKVGLRDLLRNIYKYDVDGALVVFVQNDKWRLSFVSEIRVLNDDGTIDKRATEPKRYTYLLGKNEKTKTPTDRLSLLTNKKIALEDLRAAFSVEALNNEFYKQISEYFYALVGATTTKGKRTEVREKIMKLPGVAADDRKTYQEFAVRLIGRTVFCWFLREKCSEQNKPLLPEKLLSSDAVRTNRDYYHSVLEPLFFQTLNTPMDKRIADLPAGCETVPFLNGGLFEPQIEDYYNSQSKTGSYQMYDLKIPDSWFADFFTKLEEYNFTIDENSPTEVEISVDPEMLGRIFENLLAEIDPDSGETARKATGSFYTPREIVNYMVDESLLIYLKSKLQTETVGFVGIADEQPTFWGNEARIGQLKLEHALAENRWKSEPSAVADGLTSKSVIAISNSQLQPSATADGSDKIDALETELRRLFSYSDNENPFNETETEILIKAIDNCKILDPACGSGAFPIGVLQRLVHLLGKLDADDSKWKEWLKRKAIKDTEQAYNEGDLSQRNERLRQISEAFEKDSSDFGRKLFLIENCIYGVDIQPIAAEISKLRCFLTLIVDDTIDENKPNRGVNPLPNLEFKFVTADALLKLPAAAQINLFNSDTRISELERIRHEYINSFGAEKEAAKFEYEVIRKSIKNDHENNEFKDERSIALSKWNPFGHEKVDWFDSLWMFGVKAFDIVIGNPPYGFRTVLSKEQKDYFRKIEKIEFSSGDSAELFVKISFNRFVKDKGILTFIIPKKSLYGDAWEDTRINYWKKYDLLFLLDSGKSFENVLLEAAAFGLRKSSQSGVVELAFLNKREIKRFDKVPFEKIFVKSNTCQIYKVLYPDSIFEKVQKRSFQNSLVQGRLGLAIGTDFFSDEKTDYKLLKGIDIQKYFVRSHRYLKNLGKINWKNANEFLKPKVISQVIVAHIENPFPHLKLTTCYDSEGIIITNTLMAFEIDTEISDKFWLGYLNSTFLSWYAYNFVYSRAIRTMHFYNFYIQQIPIPKVSKNEQTEIVNIVEQILVLKKADSAAETKHLERKIDNIVYRLFDLTENEVAIIEGRT